MKVLTIGDPHFKVSNVQDARLFRSKVAELIGLLRPDIVIILGDLHNDFERIHSLVMAEICALFKAVLEALGDSGSLYYIIGNHDAINNQIFLSDDHAFLPFKEWRGRIRIVDRPEVVNLGPDLGHVMLVPYVPPGRFQEALERSEYPWAQAKAIFCHQEFKGVQLGPIKSRHGDDWPLDRPLAVSGHIHEHQWLQPNILYVGEPFDGSYGSEGEKTVTFLTFTKERTLHTNINLGMPRRLTLTLTVDELKSFQKPENTHIRVYVTGTTEEIAVFKKTKEYKELSQTLKIIPKPTDPMVVRRNEGGRNYFDILRDLVAGESEHVKDALREVGADASSS